MLLCVFCLLSRTGSCDHLRCAHGIGKLDCSVTDRSAYRSSKHSFARLEASRYQRQIGCEVGDRKACRLMVAQHFGNGNTQICRNTHLLLPGAIPIDSHWTSEHDPRPFFQARISAVEDTPAPLKTGYHRQWGSGKVAIPDDIITNVNSRRSDLHQRLTRLTFCRRLINQLQYLVPAMFGVLNRFHSTILLLFVTRHVTV